MNNFSESKKMNIDKIIDDYLNTFPIPIKYKDNECIICLQNFEIESNNKFVILPCECSNSIYHTKCIGSWLKSGIKNNYCVHCNKYFELPYQISNIASSNSIDISTTNIINQNIQTPNNNIFEISNYFVYEQIETQKKIIRLEFAYIKFMIHLLINTLANTINVIYLLADNLKFYRILIIILFFKLTSNLFTFLTIKKDIGFIKFHELFSIFFQIIIIICTSYNSISVNNLLYNIQIVLFFFDLVIGIVMFFLLQWKTKNLTNN